MAKYPSCEIGAYYAIMRSARILDDLERIGVPGVRVGLFASGRGLRLGHGGRRRCKQQYAGHAAQVLALAAQCPAAAYYTKWVIAVDEDVDPTDFNEVHVGAEHALPSGRGSGYPAQHLVDRARSQPVSARGAALRLEGADQRLQAASAPQAVSALDAAAPRGLRARRRALAGARLRRAAAEASVFHKE